VHPWLDPHDPVAGFLAAAARFDLVAASVQPEVFDRPGLGDWTVLELLAHTTRAASTFVLAASSPVDGPAECADLGSYFRRALGAAADIHAQIARRGVETVATLGPDPVAGARRIVAEGAAAVAVADLDVVVDTVAGRMRLGDYLVTRTFELVVHTADLEAASSRAAWITD
jgi:hypothetical protein